MFARNFSRFSLRNFSTNSTKPEHFQLASIKFEDAARFGGVLGGLFGVVMGAKNAYLPKDSMMNNIGAMTIWSGLGGWFGAGFGALIVVTSPVTVPMYLIFKTCDYCGNWKEE